MEAPATAVNPSEIRLGNWFEHHPVWSHRNHIKCADPDRFVFQWEERDWAAIGEGLFSLDYISPIPITAEMLVKSGFAEVNTGHFPTEYVLFSPDSRVAFSFSGDDLLFELQIGEAFLQLPHIKYVHQLQNIHYSITGQELEIKWK
jgi:hypothetical protein